MDITAPLWAPQSRAAGSGSLEAVLVTPALFLMVLLIIQMGLWGHAHHIAQAAAQSAVATARVEDGSGGDGAAAATESLSVNAGGTLTVEDVEVDRGAETVTVTVTGEAASLIPGLSWPVSVSATGPVERFIPTGGLP